MSKLMKIVGRGLREAGAALKEEGGAEVRFVVVIGLCFVLDDTGLQCFGGDAKESRRCC